MFLIIEGSLVMEIEGLEPFGMSEGDLYVVKKGVKHRVSSQSECKIMLIENKTTAHTGDVKSDITKDIKDQLQ
jgi:mannose-6-phosphate isomerase-like protein (cupin superfamily)